MNAPPPPTVNLIPETAPFSPEQRAWLNGFFAGLVSLDGAGVTALSPEQNAAMMSGGAGDGDDGEAPWHDQTLPMAERMTLAEGRPLRRRMMAAMAQQDCGQCGYNCTDYSKAIFEQAEPRLNLCAPGGKATARMLKSLVEGEMGGGVLDPDTPRPAATPKEIDGPRGYSRDNPVPARFISRKRLNGEGSEKLTCHIEIDLSDSGLAYDVGDSLGIFPSNDPALVDAIIAAIDVPPDFPIAGEPFREVLIARTSLGAAPDALFQFISYLTGGERRKKAQALARPRRCRRQRCSGKR